MHHLLANAMEAIYSKALALPSDLLNPFLSAFCLCVIVFYAMPTQWGEDLRSRVFSTVNAIVCSAIGIRTLFLRHHQVLQGDVTLFTDNTDPWERAGAAWAFGYFCADAAIALLHPGLLDSLMWFHHLTGIFTNGAACLSPPVGSAAPILALFLSNEISTPFINLHHAFHANGIKDWRRTLNGGLCWLFFLVVRIIGNGRFVIGFWRLLHTPTGDTLWSTLPVHMMTVAVLLPLVMAMNTWWFYKLTQGLVRAATGGSRGRERRQTSTPVRQEGHAGVTPEVSAPGGGPLGECMRSEGRTQARSSPSITTADTLTTSTEKPSVREGGGSKGPRRRLA